MTVGARSAYLLVTALLGLGAGLALAGPGEAGRAETAAGLGSAWLVQAAAWWVLTGDLAAGRDATRSWVAGIAARVGGLAVLAAAAGPTGLERPTTLLVYAGAALGLLTLEAFWLHAAGPGRRDAGDETPR